MTRFALELQYDGTAYHGWQIQENALTVQTVLNDRLSKILQQPISTMGCGRTDTGVHASHFVCHFDAENPTFDQFLFRLNNLLPHDISVQSLYEIPTEVNVRFAAKSRTYFYYIQQVKSVFDKNYSFYFRRELDMYKMNTAGEMLLKNTDFGAFCKSHSSNITNICRVEKAEWTKQDSRLIFEIKADRFLRNMVRAIVGTMLDLGENKISPNQFEEIVASGDRKLAGQSVPAHGLFLANVEYDKNTWTLIEKIEYTTKY
ncbi:MAG: tRNA pseudouridine(38-40) synthase TruA [Flavobacteriales bacterium]|nr:tRNA pseudouridine(38-40) synthase TruA [Flavobacteriales bacterium]